MRAVLILLLAAALAASEWSGTFEVVETVAGPAPSGADRTEIEDLARSLEGRLAKAREALRTAAAPAARTYRKDISQLEAELQSLALERGGTVTLSRTVYTVRGDRIIADGDEARLIVVPGRAVVAAGGRREPVELAPVPAARAPEGAADAPPVAGVATRRGTIAIDGDPTTVVWAPGLPNVYALTRVAAQARDPVLAALAAVPGLPLEVERRTKKGVQRWTVQRLAPGAVDERAFAE